MTKYDKMSLSDIFSSESDEFLEDNSRFMLVAYRPNGSDYVRGCLMGSSNSEFSVEHFREVDKLIKAVAEYKFKDHTSDYEYSHWELQYFVDGIRLDDSWANELNDYIREESAKILNTTIQEHEAKKKQKELEKALAEERAKQEAERAQYLALKQKYEANNG